MILTLLDKKKTRAMKKKGYEEGFKEDYIEGYIEGFIKGFREGYEEGQRQIILHVLQSHSPEETASILGLPLKQVLAVANISSEEK